MSRSTITTAAAISVTAEYEAQVLLSNKHGFGFGSFTLNCFIVFVRAEKYSVISTKWSAKCNNLIALASSAS